MNKAATLPNYDDGYALPVDQSTLDAYFKAARSFDYDRRKADKKSKKIAWSFSGVLGFGFVCSVVALASLAPLKELVPLILRVDQTTGVPDVLTTLSDGQVEYEETLSRYFLKRYVDVRESYVYATRENIFKEAMLFSGPEEQREYSLWFNSDQKDAPQVLFGKKTKVEIDPRSISFLSSDQAQVRFYRIVKSDDEAIRTPWVSTITFKYQPKAEMKDRDRLINPLGFTVTDYKSDPEVL